MKRHLAILLAVVISGSVLISCTKTGENQPKTSPEASTEASPEVSSAATTEAPSETPTVAPSDAPTEAPSTATKNSDGTVTFKDMLGREVTVTTTPNSVVTDAILPFPATYFVAFHSTNAINAMHPASKGAAVNSMLKILSPEVASARTDIFTGTEPNIEEILKLSPDIVFALSDKEDAIKKYDEAKINAVAIKAASAANGDVFKTLGGWFDILKNTGGDAQAMDLILAEAKETEAMIGEKLKSAKSTPSAMFLFSNSEEKIEVTGKNFFGEYWLKATGAKDPASEEIVGRKPVNMEQIYKWDPEIIYITNFTETTPEDLYENKIKGQDWSKLKAVKNKQVYKIPLGIYRWFTPSGDSPLMLKWIAQKNHPDLFDYSIEDEIKAYYQKHYNYILTDEHVKFILNPALGSASGYKSAE